MYKHVTHCRCCLSTELEPAFDLGLQPLANNFTTPTEPKAGFFPLQVMFCPRCTQAQLSVAVDPHILYSNYCYVTSASLTMRNHFALLWDMFKERSPARSILEVGSNDGRFLNHCLDMGAARVCGVDPAENLQPNNTGQLYSICSTFNSAVAEQARNFLYGTDVIVARHVFGHVDDLQAFMRAVEAAASTETLVVIEVPYVLDMLDGLEFDTIYHEHLSYFSVRAITALLSNSDFRIDEIHPLDIHGGAIAVILRHRAHNSVPKGSVGDYLAQENFTLNDWIRFEDGCRHKMLQMQYAVRQSKTVCGFGASAKSTVWMNSCSFTTRDIQYICDCTPQKIGRESPGSQVPIAPESALLANQPEAAVVFAWNFKSEIIQRNATYLERGGKFIIPGPQIEVVTARDLVRMPEMA